METTNQEKTAVKQMREYISKHLQEPITSSELAKSVGYSQYHAARLFKAETGLAPFEYIRRERLLQSAHALRSGKPRVLDVALDFVFDSHEGFTRAFANAFGITPKKYANYPKPHGWLIPYRYLDRNKSKSEDLSMETKIVTIFTQIIERPARKLILRRAKSATHYFEYCEEFGCVEDGTGNPIPADILSRVKEALYEQVGVWLPENMRKPKRGDPDATGIYASAVEVPFDYAGEIPDGFDIIDLAPCKLLVFQGEPFRDEEFGEAIDALWAAMEKFNPEVYGYQYADELAPRMQLAPHGWRGYIEMRAVREIR